MQKWKMQEEIAGVENARAENEGATIYEQEALLLQRNRATRYVG